MLIELLKHYQYLYYMFCSEFAKCDYHILQLDMTWRCPFSCPNTVNVWVWVWGQVPEGEFTDMARVQLASTTHRAHMTERYFVPLTRDSLPVSCDRRRQKFMSVWPRQPPAYSPLRNCNNPTHTFYFSLYITVCIFLCWLKINHMAGYANVY